MMMVQLPSSYHLTTTYGDEVNTDPWWTEERMLLLDYHDTLTNEGGADAVWDTMEIYGMVDRWDPDTEDWV